MLMRFFILLFVLSVQSDCFAQDVSKDSVLLFAYFKNNGEDGLHYAYSTDGYNWAALKKDSSFLTPTAGKDKLMRDPCIIKGGDGLFHMVWTVSWNEKGIGYANSKDLLNWSEQRDIPVMEHEAGAMNCWAPEIFYDDATNQYMIYWATTIPGRFAAGDTSGDGKYNHRMYYTLSKDFNTFTKAAVLYDKGFNVIDASIQKSGNTYFMFLKNETLKPKPEKNIRIATSTTLNGNYGEASAPITGNYWAEGPTIINWMDKWFIYFDKYNEHQYGMMVSGDLKNWKDVSTRLNLPKGLRHGTVIKISGKEFKKLAAYR